MMEVVYYHKLDAGFVSFPAENYVDYMTNVMPVLERRVFYLPKRQLAVFCEVESKFDESVLLWGMFPFESFPDDSVEVFVDSGKLDLVVDSLVGVSSSCVCGVCDEVLGGVFRGCV